MPHPICITNHAAERAVERHDYPSIDHARIRLRTRFRQSIKVPWRHARHLLGNGDWESHRSNKADIRVAGPCLLVCRGKTVITTWRLGSDELATVAWWILTGAWVVEQAPWA